MVVRVGKSVFWGIVLGYLAALLLSRSTWLEMRINTSLAISIFAILGGALGLLKPIQGCQKWFFGTEILVVIIFVITYHDLSALAVIPAIKLKEAFLLQTLSLTQTNIVLILLMLTGNALWCIHKK